MEEGCINFLCLSEQRVVLLNCFKLLTVVLLVGSACLIKLLTVVSLVGLACLM
jgi:hypothetical protein